LSAAKNLAAALVSEDSLVAIGAQLQGRTPIVVAVQAIESAGVNVIPVALAETIAWRLTLPLDSDIVQINRVGRTRSSGYYRLAMQPLFAGAVEENADYLLVDDFIGQGATLANLKGHIEALGARAILATALTGKRYSAKLALSPDTLKRLGEKHGAGLEKWWREYFGYGFDALSESEARYLLNSPDADTIRNRVLAEQEKARP
jgi:hypoxanthine-guanine phosphoribosyltransferase